jgi:predicted KAP-like P-loop ATPase
MWPDNESGVDLLGFRVHSEFIYEIVTDKKMLPVTIGLFGDWGSGKTSVMKMIEKKLSSIDDDINSEDNANVVCLYFNGWQFEGYDDAKSAILSSILMQLAEHKKIGEKIKDKAASLMKSVNWMRLIGMSVKNVALPAILAYLTGGASLIPSLAGFGKKFLGVENSKTRNEKDMENVERLDWEELIKADKSDSGPLDVRTFRERFSEMLKDTKIDALVILIDDLDRCTPDSIIDNLEAIKLFLNVENTAFVIGADPRIVRYAVERRYLFDRKIEWDKESASRIVNDYLEKLIQIPYHLPRLSPSEIESYMNLLFCEKKLAEEDFKKIINGFQDFRNKDMYSTFGYSRIKNILGTVERNRGLEEDLSMCSNIAHLITDGLKGNPRQVKRFLNAFILRKKLAKVAKLKKVKDDVLVKLMVLEYVEDDCFRELFNWQSSQDGLPKEIENL